MIESATTEHRILWLDPGFGASGDMILGALVGLGAPLEQIVAGLDGLGIQGWTVTRSEALRCSLSATRIRVDSEEQHHHRTWTAIDALLAEADLPEPVRTGSRSTFRRLGEAEAAIHNVTIDEVHFHEVGAVDAIVDIVGSWLALHLLDVSEVVVGPFGMGHGSVQAAHGTLPVPAPATASLLVGADLAPLDIAAETVTPTGAATLTTMADRFGPMPPGRMIAIARGAGGRDPEGYPNVVTALLLTAAPNATATSTTSTITTTITTNLDDTTPEVVARTIQRCLAVGADDAWATPIVMKKGRPGHTVSAMCDPTVADAVADVIFSETGTLGVRVATSTKQMLDRRFETVTVRGHQVRIKVGPYGAKPEYDDLAAAADALDLPLRQLSSEALSAWMTTGGLANGSATDQTATSWPPQ